MDEQHVARLHPDAKEMLNKSVEDKILYIQQDRWLPYPAADRLLDKLESMLKMPDKIRPPSMLIVGDSHCGKSSLVRHFRDKHPPTDGFYESALPVFYLETCPPEPDEDRLYSEILKTLMIPFRSNDKPEKKLDEVEEQFNLIGVKVVILDEIGNSLSGSGLKQRVFMNAIKNLHTKIKRPIILVGTIEALYVTSSDKQFESRFKPEHLPRWEYGKDFQRFLAMFELTLPLGNPSLLATPDMSKMIFNKAESGCIGDYIDVICAAAEMAIKNGAHKITAKEIDECDFTPSSMRQPKP